MDGLALAAVEALAALRQDDGDDEGEGEEGEEGASPDGSQKGDSEGGGEGGGRKSTVHVALSPQAVAVVSKPLFSRALEHWWAAARGRTVPPCVVRSNCPADAYVLWRAVHQQGGPMKVMASMQWAAIGRLFNPPDGYSMLSVQTRRAYEKVLGGFDVDIAAGRLEALLPGLAAGAQVTRGGSLRRPYKRRKKEAGEGAAGEEEEDEEERDSKASGLVAQPRTQGAAQAAAFVHMAMAAAAVDSEDAGPRDVSNSTLVVQFAQLTEAASSIKVGDVVEARLPGRPSAAGWQGGGWQPARVLAVAPGSAWEGGARLLLEALPPGEAPKLEAAGPASTSAAGAQAQAGQQPAGGQAAAVKEEGAAAAAAESPGSVWLPLLCRGPWRRPYTAPRHMVRLLPRVPSFTTAEGATVQDGMMVVPAEQEPVDRRKRVSMSMLRGRLKPACTFGSGPQAEGRIESYCCLEHAAAAASGCNIVNNVQTVLSRQ